MTIDELQTFIATKAREVYRRDHDHVPMFFLDFHKPFAFKAGDPEADFAVVPVLWKTEQDRQMISVTMKALCGIGVVRNIAAVHEVYMLATKGQVPDVLPSEHPDSISVLFLHIESSKFEKRTGYWPVINADTKKARLGDWVDLSGMDRMEGRFTNFFGPKRAMQ